MDTQKILDKIRSLPDDYWINRFKDVEQGRQDKIDDLLAALLFLFDDKQNKLTDLITLHYDRLDQKLNRAEVQSIKNEINTIAEDLKDKYNLEFDRDVLKKADRINTRTVRFDALKVLILAHINALYALAGEEIYNHLRDVTDYYHASTVYEVFRAAGYGSKDIKKLSDDDLAVILSQIWRSTDEAFDDVVWRYGRTFIIELQQTVGRSRFMNTDMDDLIILVERMFRNKQNELGNLVRTDSAYYSTLGQKKGFEDLIIDEAVFTAVLDERTSDMCREADGNVIAVEDITPWVNAPPLHFSCRSSLYPIVKRVDWLTGETYEVKGNFDNWYTTWE